MLRRMGLSLALVAAILLLVPAAASAARLAHVTRGLDYLHAKQSATGGFQDPFFTPWCVLAIRAARESVTSSAWTIDGKDPFTYMNSLNHPVVAASGTVSNVPSYYSKTILAYVAAGKKDRIYSAGAPPTDLLQDLMRYRHDDGHFSLSISNPNAAAVNTTIWAMLAMRAAGITDSRLSTAVEWLMGQQLDNGGFPSEPGRAADVDDTAAAIQALLAGGVGVGEPAIQNGIGFLRSAQRSDGGFPNFISDGYSYAESTSWAIQAIRAVGQDPASWTKCDKTPLTALKALQPVPGSGLFEHRTGRVATPLLTTPQAIVALSGVSFNTFPRSLPSTVTPMVFRPQVSDVKPAADARLTSSTVTFSASYVDGEGGTGINTGAVRIFIDGVDRTKSATVTGTALVLKLSGVPNGTHKWELRVADRSGNVTKRVRNFTIAVTTSTGTGTSTPSPSTTYRPPSGASVYPTSRPTATTTLYPTPTPSSSMPSVVESVDAVPYGDSVTGTQVSPGLPQDEPSTLSPSPLGEDESSGAGILGGALLAALPVGAALSYLAMRRQAAHMAPAGVGKTLGGGGTPWQRFASRLGVVGSAVGAASHRVTSRSSRSKDA
jgi:hypothetical protein